MSSLPCLMHAGRLVSRLVSLPLCGIAHLYFQPLLSSNFNCKIKGKINRVRMRMLLRPSTVRLWTHP